MAAQRSIRKCRERRVLVLQQRQDLHDHDAAAENGVTWHDIGRGAQLLWNTDCGVLPVIDGSKVVGVVTGIELLERALLWRW